MENTNNMAQDLTIIFKEYYKSSEMKLKKNVKFKSRQINTNNVNTDFKAQSVKLLESVFNLRTLLEALHEEYVSLTQNDESNEKCIQMEINSNDMMKLCKECLNYIKSSKFINPSLPKDVRMHREAVVQMLILYVKSCEDLSKENMHVKRIRGLVKKKHKPIDDSLNIVSGSINYVDSDFSSQDLETMQINTDGVFKRLNADLAEKELIEKQIYEIGKMNQTLADNVLEQHNLISHLELTSGHSNLNIEFGNDQIKRAMQNQSNMRFWVIFILLVLALSLMFIDWYRT